MRELKIFASLVAVFLVAYFLPLGNPRIQQAILEAFKLLQWYAREHTLACVVPALFIAGGIITFLTPEAVMRYLGPQANRVAAYGVASVSGAVLAVCSCSVLPMFAGIYRMGAGIGPASAFLYSGPAINVLAIFLTARVLGFSIGLWRAVGAIVFAVVIGLIMAGIFERRRAGLPAGTGPVIPDAPRPRRSGLANAVLLGFMIAFLVFSDWYNPGNATLHLTDGRVIHGVVLEQTRDELRVQVQQTADGLRAGDKLTLPRTQVARIEKNDSLVLRIYAIRWYLAAACGLVVLLMVWRTSDREEIRQWLQHTWEFTKLLVPLLFGGVFVVGFIGALLPDQQVASLVGDNGVRSNLIASVVGALFYFATLTEIPIVQALTEHGMASGPALALLLAGPALSLPNMMVIYKVMGWRRATVFCVAVVVMATLTGWIYGHVHG